MIMIIYILFHCYLKRDFVDDHGNQFWSGNKLFPTATRFNQHNPIHVAFVHYAALLLASCFDIEGKDDEQYIVEYVI